jgi:hypothetical protein
MFLLEYFGVVFPHDAVFAAMRLAQVADPLAPPTVILPKGFHEGEEFSNRNIDRIDQVQLSISYICDKLRIVRVKMLLHSRSRLCNCCGDRGPRSSINATAEARMRPMALDIFRGARTATCV